MQKRSFFKTNLMFLALLLAMPFIVFAAPNVTTYQAKIFKPDGAALEALSVNFKFTILNPAGVCILFSETYSGINMQGSGGLVSFSLGSGIKTFPTSGTTTFSEVFSNVTPSLDCAPGGPVSFTPGASDTRKIVMQFHDGNGWQTLPAMSINAVPYAMYATEAQKISGLPTCNPGEALSYNGASFTCEVISGSVTSATVTAAYGYTPADSATVSSLVSNVASGNANILAVSSTVFSVSTAVTSLSNSVAASFASMASSQWNTSGTTINYMTGNVGIGTSAPNYNLHVQGNDMFFQGIKSQNTAATGAAAFAAIGDAQAIYVRALGTNSGIGLADSTNLNDAVQIGTNTGGFAPSKMVVGTNSAIPLQLYTNENVRMTITSAGNVGIGTTAPGTALVVSGQAVANGNARYNTALIDSTNFFAGAGAGIALSGKYNSAGAVAEFASIQSGKSNATDGDYGGYFSITTRSNGSAPLERLRIDNNGNVGIGTTTPSAKLHLSAGTSSTASLKFTSGTLLTSPQSGTMEYDGLNFYLTDSTNTRRSIATGSIAGTIDNASAINSTGNIVMTPTGSLVVSSTTVSTDSSTGALVIAGGLGVAGALNIVGNIATSGAITTSSNIQAVSITATSGMISPYIYGSTSSFSHLYLDSTTHSTKGYVLMATNGGRVGIGTTNPSRTLSVSGTASFFSPTQFDGVFWGNGLGQTFADIKGYSATNDAGGLSLYVSGTKNVQLLANGQSWLNGGNVGIGTSSPAVALHVVNTSNAVAEAQISNSLNGSAAGAQLSLVGNSNQLNLFSFPNSKVGSTASLTNAGMVGLRTTGGLKMLVGTATSIPLYIATADTIAMTISASGTVGIGTTTPSYKLDVSGTINIASGSALAFGGTSVCTAAGCTSSSDERLKENIKPLEFDLNKLLSLSAVQYDWKDKSKYGDKHQIGFIAQDLEKIYPEVVYTDKNTGLKSVTYGHLVAPMIESLKSLYKRILSAEDRNKTQDRQIASITYLKADKEEIEQLKAENAALKAYLCSKDQTAPICK